MIGFTRPKRFCVPENRNYTAITTESLDALEAACVQANADLAAAKKVIDNIVESEIEPLKALLYQVLCNVSRDAIPVDLAKRIRDALGES